ncbi:hypothetical protein PRIPAC_91362 [Pristionchus pacificus]|uniref:Uncharacterized protein n=1 Tax=Pristionchus pacificus TaxID=54126 RepID=A0A2A6CX93_PRIPA|nr:hypothetical protein PRIPAC_91362 [Pristionchus pacificus]|eukprot:PDM82651.1 hypothetical protein PRIPAC_37044 [Pristionchus pacificus]
MLSRFLCPPKEALGPEKVVGRAVEVNKPPLHSSCSITGQSDEKARGLKRRCLHPGSPSCEIAASNYD